MDATYFRSPAEFRTWLKRHHAKEKELWVGYYKKDSGKPSMTWPESVDEALCFGWIDGIRKRVDDTRYVIRFSPRKARSVWSAVNIKRAAALKEEGRMQPAGLAAFELRQENRSGIYSYEQRQDQLPEPYAAILKRNKAAWTFFQSRTPGYRKTIGWWIVSAKKEETRLKRLETLIADCAAGRTLPQLTRTKPSG
jgi:uncharacterized protein YdeI (YjbR/CyaY-like superfamily)